LKLALSSKAVCRVALLCCYAAATCNAQFAPLKLKQTIPLPGVEGRIDHFAADSSGQRLFVCALGNNSLEVIDLRNGERVHSITGLGSPQGVGYAPAVNRLLVANDKGGVCKIYDGKSFQTVGEVILKMTPTTFVTMTREKNFMSDSVAVALLWLMRSTGNKSVPSRSARIPKLFSWKKTAAEFSSTFPIRVTSQ